MAEWLIERGIGETRAVLVADNEILEARIDLDGVAPAGAVIHARLVSGGSNARNAIARDDAGTEYLLPQGASQAAEGGELMLEVTRSAIPGKEPWKRPLARIAHDPGGEAEVPGGRELTFPGQRDELSEAGWNDVIEEARSGLVRFAGGELRIEAAAAMTLIDVDGGLDPRELAIHGAAEAARAIRRLDIGGSIGIDLPTTSGKAARQAAAAAIDDHLPQPFERTAVNGFGFVQIVRPRHRASLIELGKERAAFEARALLRRIALEPAGAKRMVVHPAVAAVLDARPDWLGALGRQVGGPVALHADPALPISGGYAEATQG